MGRAKARPFCFVGRFLPDLTYRSELVEHHNLNTRVGSSLPQSLVVGKQNRAFALSDRDQARVGRPELNQQAGIEVFQRNADFLKLNELTDRKDSEFSFASAKIRMVSKP